MAWKQCVVIKAKFPTHKQPETSARSQEAIKKFPRDAAGGTVLAYIAKATFDGIETELIIEPAEGKLEAELQHAAARMQMFHDIEGAEYSIEAYSNLNKPI